MTKTPNAKQAVTCDGVSVIQILDLSRVSGSGQVGWALAHAGNPAYLDKSSMG
jgi:hypothetical protein